MNEERAPAVHNRRGKSGDAESLAEKLRRIKGEVRFDKGSRALYATDSSNYRQTPIGVVIPKSKDDVATTLEICREFGAPITCRGAATSLAGQCCNVAVILDFSKYMNRVLEIDPTRRIARVEPGVILDDLRNSSEKYKLTFGPDPSPHDCCTLGGMIGNNSCGVHSAMAQFYGQGARTSDQVEELEILTYDGLQMRLGATSDAALKQIVSEGGKRADVFRQLISFRDRYIDRIRTEIPQLPRRVSGYALNQLLPENGFHLARALTGTEGTCVTILEATVHLMHSPPVRHLIVLGFQDVYTAGDHVAKVSEHKPTGLEGIDDILIRDVRARGLHLENLSLLPEGRGWLLVEIGADTEDEANEKTERLVRDFRDATCGINVLKDKHEQEKLWKVRESSLGATAHRGPDQDAWEGWEDSAVPPEKLGDYLRDFRQLLDRFGYGCTLYGHFAGGCVHTRIDFGLKTAEGIRTYRKFIHEAAELVVSYGGSLSGEHGDGQSRAELLPKMYGPELVRAFGEFKAIWDPQNKMNPHKVIDPYRADENLRYGPEYNPPQWKTHFQFRNDNGSFPYAMERCVGVGKCRQLEGGTMCPSFMVTRDELHTTRGRARMLWEMLNGNVLEQTWRSDEVLESLDLCLSCKACKSECPVHVDMATYKAEFLSHYYKGRLRPRAAYSMGLIYWWARMASYFPSVANFFTQTRPFNSAMKWIGGIAAEREMPKFAGETFREWFRSSRRKEAQISSSDKERSDQSLVTSAATQRVFLWVDTFTNYFHPDIGKAAVEVLEAAGCDVVISDKTLCCGRPLYDFGMLPTAKRVLEKTLEHLHPELARSTPIVGLEPSCVTVFRDELRNLFPNSEDARRLAKTVFTLSEFLEKKAPHFSIPKFHRRALVQPHCHHKAIMKFHCDESVFKKMELDYELPDAGCCGMAGSFGFEKEKYDVSVKCGERVLLPAVRHAAKDTLIIADGFSCRTQIEQLTERKAMHIAEVLQLALRERERVQPQRTVKKSTADRVAQKRKRSLMEMAGGIIGAIAGVFTGIAAFFSRHKGRH